MHDSLGPVARAATWVRFVLLVPLILGAALGLAYAWALGVDGLHIIVGIFHGEVEIGEATVGLLEIIDGIILESVLVLIVFGTFWIYVIPPRSEDKLPSALQGLNSGKLKEKLASSIVTASAVYMFRYIVQLFADSPEVFSWAVVVVAGIIAVFHTLFIFGYNVISSSNRKDPHKQSKHEPGSEHEAQELSDHSHGE